MDTVEKRTSQSDCTFPLWPMTGTILLSKLSNEYVGATIERERGSVSSGNLSSKLVCHATASCKLVSSWRITKGEHFGVLNLNSLDRT